MKFHKIHFPEISSTNSALKELSSSRELPDFTLLSADFQTQGRGQRGNFWEAENGKNLLFSLFVKFEFFKPAEQFLISQITALALQQAVSAFLNREILIKWPNDIYFQEKKLAGILIENSFSAEKIFSSIIGVGLNVNQEIFTSDAPNPISMKLISGEEFPREKILEKFSERFFLYFSKLKNGEFQEIREQFQTQLFRREGFHRYADENGEFLAKFETVLPTGELVLRDEFDKNRKFEFKQVKFLL